MHRETGQQGFADALVDVRTSRRAELMRIAELVDWSAIEALVSEIYARPTGRPSYPPLVMVRALLIQAWYGLSDPGLEEALDDTLSFRRFVGLSLEDAVPDHSTICRFRQEMERRGLSERMFEEVNRQLDERGLMVKRGTLIDATLIEAQARRPDYAAGAGAKGEVDRDADWTRRGSHSFFGYKAHVAADADTLVIRKALMTSAKVFDSEVADRLVSGDERAVYADKAYEHKDRRGRLKARGIKDRIMHRDHKNQPALPHWQARRNALIAPIRCKVEKIFGTLKRSYGLARVRFFSLARNAVDLHFVCLAYNLRRALRCTGTP